MKNSVQVERTHQIIFISSILSVLNQKSTSAWPASLQSFKTKNKNGRKEVGLGKTRMFSNISDRNVQGF